ncbi:peptidoglycan hydrolase-like protein with peptidoglycan-binding domain [Kribbella sp. VKM Ac-2527]|uniref:Peptidoglycan hydrolase-like protein with peptidoglycan-binding domain n=1 Tax=Kribbella caucasensis TaxID=2512215 RepID=A0A4R6JER6_9ACTN|nr:L,D-transpeptidase family protein [Kribbella sp. VKM Ac-2527]TDO34359.1 peptidoglycan hydrolase-like protein with peptidoglycan-binding domain [Kribbella sp. VKM Ac-2527]
MRARNWVRRLYAVRHVLAAAVVTAAIAGIAGYGLNGSESVTSAGSLSGSGDTAAATPVSTTDLKTVPFEVSGELPIYPEALWRNGSTSAEVRKVEARLIQLKLLEKRWLDNEYGTMTRSAVKKFQTSKGIPELGYVDQNTWDQLKSATREPTQVELYPPAPVVNGKRLDQRCATGVALCIDKTTRKLRYVVDGVVKLQFDVRFGAKKTATREGSFTVGWKSRDHVSKLYDSPMPFAMFFSGGQAVHYSSDFAARGYAGASHGCVNVRDLARIKWLFDQVNLGDKVIVYRS